jgi:DNA repair protein RadA/Sms
MPPMAAGSKKKTRFSCRECGHSEPRWVGRCPACGQWNSMDEEEAPAKGPATAHTHRTAATDPGVQPLTEVESPGAGQRLCTTVGELDRVLGGGLVPGSAVLLGGDPGIGKSTLALQLAAGLVRSSPDISVLYVSGEESPAQVRLRAERLGVAEDRILILGATEVERVRRALREGPARKAQLVIVDSVQTIYTERIDSAPGSVSQLREASAELLVTTRHEGVAVLLIGHVTKEGMLAGPRVLEHMVDTVLYFEGDRNHAFRIVRAVKNRFGPANEIGVFEMRSGGLAEIPNPSEVLAGLRSEPVPGSAVTACIEGSRPVLVEVQALVAPSNPGSARRTSLGVDHGRVAMLAAVMEKRLGLAMIAQDIFVNTAGGVRIDDPGVDVAVIAALASSYLERPLPASTLILGEVGLTGEVRPVSQAAARLKEARRLGFTHAVIPAANAGADTAEVDIERIPVRSVAEAWEALS